MITRSNLAEQLREYQIRSKHDWASVSFFSSTSNNVASTRVDVLYVIWELLVFAFLVFSAVSLYFRYNGELTTKPPFKFWPFWWVQCICHLFCFSWRCFLLLQVHQRPGITEMKT